MTKKKHSFSLYDIKKPRFVPSWAYIAGLIETDGSLSLRLDKNGRLFSTVSISQQNRALLFECQTFFKKHQLRALLDDPSKETKTRAPSIRIRGPIQTLKLFVFLKQYSNPNGVPFCSQKYRDFLVMEYALTHRKSLNFEQKIDFVMTLHKTHQQEPDLSQYTFKKTRRQHEFDLGLQEHQSVGAAQLILKQIDAIYKKHCQTDLDALANMFDPFWYTGLIDGDGYFGLRLRVNKKSVSFYPSFSIGMEMVAAIWLGIGACLPIDISLTLGLF